MMEKKNLVGDNSAEGKKRPQIRGLHDLNRRRRLNIKKRKDKKDAYTNWLYGMLNELSTAVARLSPDLRIEYYNREFLALSYVENYLPSVRKSALGQEFYSFFGKPEILGPDFCPFDTARKTRMVVTTTLQFAHRQFDVKITPLIHSDGITIKAYIVELVDSSGYVALEKKLESLQEVGRKLSDLTTKEIWESNSDERTALLKSRIQTYFKEIFGYTIFEIRLLQRDTNELIPFISEGLSEEAQNRVLHAEATNNGITGHAAHFNSSYVCDDPTVDYHFMASSTKIKSAITITLSYFGTSLGTLNVESHESYAFTRQDSFLLQIFADEVSRTLHTLSLLDQEGAKASLESVEKLQHAFAEPVDEVLRSVSSALDMTSKIRNSCEEYEQMMEALMNEGDEKTKSSYNAIVAGLKQIESAASEVEVESRTALSSVRETRNLVLRESDRLKQISEWGTTRSYPLLKGRRVLVLDKETQIRQAAHDFFEHIGCYVETANNSIVALQMLANTRYDLVLAERFPLGMNTVQFFIRIRDLFPKDKNVPMLMTAEQGVYDPDHIFQAVQAVGLKYPMVSRWPLIPKQLIPLFENIVKECGERDENNNLIMYETTEEVINLANVTRATDDPEDPEDSDSSRTTHTIKGFLNGTMRYDQWAATFYKGKKIAGDPDFTDQDNSDDQLQNKNNHSGNDIDAT